MATATPKRKTAALAPTTAAPRKTREQKARDITRDTIRKMKPIGNTALKDFSRTIRDEPHKNVYTIKLYFKRSGVPADRVLQWLRERYIEAKGRTAHHGTRYELRAYGTAKDANGKVVRPYADYVFLEALTDHERVMFTLEFGDVTDEKIVRDGKLRRPRLNKAQKKEFDAMVNQFYLDVEMERAAMRDGRSVD